MDLSPELQHFPLSRTHLSCKGKSFPPRKPQHMTTKRRQLSLQQCGVKKVKPSAEMNARIQAPVVRLEPYQPIPCSAANAPIVKESEAAELQQHENPYLCIKLSLLVLDKWAIIQLGLGFLNTQRLEAYLLRIRRQEMEMCADDDSVVQQTAAELHENSQAMVERAGALKRQPPLHAAPKKKQFEAPLRNVLKRWRQESSPNQLVFDRERWYTREDLDDERVCARGLATLLVRRPMDELRFDLEDKHDQALQMIRHRDLCIITGAAGTGKTHALKLAAEHAQSSSSDEDSSDEDRQNRKLTVPRDCTFRAVAFCGRAAKNLAQTVDRRRSLTLHKYAWTQRRPVHAATLFVDESSMVSIPHIALLLKHSRFPSKLVLVGDPNQLPAVGKGGALLHELLRLPDIPRVKLSIPRRNPRRDFCTLAARVLRQEAGDSLEDVMSAFHCTAGATWIEAPSGEIALRDLVVQTYLKVWNQLTENDRYHELLLIVPNSKETLHGGKKREVCTPVLNRHIRHGLLPRIKDNFCEGDKVTPKENLYDDDNKLELANGEVVRVTTSRPGLVTVRTEEGGYYHLDPEKLMPGHAITVHKAQGLGARHVLLALPDNAGVHLLNRTLLYTAMTRTRESFTLLASPAALRQVLSRTAEPSLNTTLLVERIQDYVREMRN